VDPKRIVREGYDRLGEGYRSWSDAEGGAVRRWFLDEIGSRLRPGDRVLELGCGPGVDAVELARGRRYTGVDLSPVMVEAARRRVPDGTFLVGDLSSVVFPPGSFDAVVALYVFGHLPAEEQAGAIERAFAWLRPGGVLCASYPRGVDPGAVQEDFVGVPMFFGGIGVHATRRALREAGFVPELDEVREEREPDGVASFLWVVARRPAG